MVRTVGGVKVKVDVVFPRRRVAVFVDGCFWHGCPDHGRVPATNRQYWPAKLERNRQRDRRVSSALEQDGWIVLRFWEHEPLEAITQRVADVIAAQDGW